MFTKTAKSSKMMVVVGITVFAICMIGVLILAVEYVMDPENDSLYLLGVVVLAIGITVFFLLERMANHRVRKHFTNLHQAKNLRRKAEKSSAEFIRR